MIQDIAPHRFDNAYANRRPAAAGDRILCFSKDEIFIRECGGAASGYEFIKYEELFGGADADAGRQDCLTYLFSIDETGYFLMDRENMEKMAARGEVGGFQPIQIFRTMPEGDTIPLAMMTGFHIYTWMRKNRFCGCCGHETQRHGEERALFCPNCRNLIFPQIAPAVAVAVTDGDRILLARSAQGGFRRFALIAGYVEVGETIEETIRREVMEEVGLKVKNPEFFASQPWGLTGIEMLGYFVELDGSNQVTLQESELAEARWFAAEEVDRDMALHSLSYTMIDEFCRRKLGK